jgi:purine-cytosine permease-like protein
MDNITNFLYFIGSVFAPMIAILLADYFVLKTDFSSQKIKVSRLAVWLAGFIAYRLLMNTDLITGCTIPDMIFTFAVTVIVGLCSKKK